MQGLIGKYGIEGLCRRWLFEKDAKEFMDIGVGRGITLGAVLINPDIHAKLSPQLLESCHNLMGDKAQSADQVCNLLVEKMMNGNAAELGFISKIKGQIGEDVFAETARHAGFNAHLASLGNQEAWDVAITPVHGLTKYVQVKTMELPEQVIGYMKEVAGKVAAGKITDGDIPVNDIIFAVPDDIHDAVVHQAAEAGLTTKIMSFHLSAQDAAKFVQDGFDSVFASGLGDLFQRLAGGTLTAAVLHTLVYAYLLHKGARQAENMLRDVATQTAVTGGGIAAGLGTQTLLKGFGVVTGSLPAVAVIMATALSARGILSRIISRRSHELWLEQENRDLGLRLDSPNLLILNSLT